MAAVTFRQAVPDDFQAICDLIPSAEELFLVYPKGKFPLTVRQVEKLLRRRMDPTVLLTGGTVAGFGCYYQYKPGESVFIGNVVLDRSHRGKGLGKELVLHLIQRAFRKYDLPRVQISVYSHNLAALLLYASLGFRPYAIAKRKDPWGGRVALLHLRLKRDAAKRRTDRVASA